MNNSIQKRIGTAAAMAVVLALGVIISSQRGKANGDDRRDESSDAAKIRIGFQIAPVPLNLKHKDPNLVGLGSYIVNTQGDCDGCHSPSPAAEYVFGGIPYFNQHPTKVNPAVYLAGGQDFGSLDPGGLSAHIISRNLTPDKTGLPEGGATFSQFLDHIRKGTDDDHWHPTCTGALNAGCVPPPFDGNLLQVMPWPTYANMTTHDLRASYEYLSAVPCIEGDPGNPDGADTHGKRCK